MSDNEQAQLIRRCRGLAQIAAAAVILLGCVALIGWSSGISAFKAVRPGLVAMKPSTAICFALAGVSLLLQVHKAPLPANVRRRLPRLLAGCVVLIALLTLTEYALGRDLGLDQLVFRETPEQAGASFPGRMGLTSAINFTLLGLALLLLDAKSRREQFPAESLTLAAAVFTMAAVIGYFYGVETLYWIVPYVNIALNAVVAFLLLCLGILLARPEHGVVAAIVSEHLGGLLARRMLLPAVLVPILVGWLHVAGERAALYGPGFGAALFTSALILIFTGQVWWATRTLSRVEARRKQAELEREKLIHDLQTALAQVKTLSGLLPICAHCKKIRDDKGYWNQVEFYISDRSNAKFSHGICPECARELYPEFYRDSSRSAPPHLEPHGPQ